MITTDELMSKLSKRKYDKGLKNENMASYIQRERKTKKKYSSFGKNIFFSFVFQSL